MSPPPAGDERSRVLGGIVCLATTLGGVLFLYGLAIKSYWALAVPLAALVLFVLGLVFWVGWTIATVQIEPEGESFSGGGGPGAATVTDPSSSPDSDPESGTSS